MTVSDLAIIPGARVSANIAAQISAWMSDNRMTAGAAADWLNVNQRTLEGWLAGRPCRDALPVLNKMKKG